MSPQKAPRALAIYAKCPASGAGPTTSCKLRLAWPVAPARPTLRNKLQIEQIRAGRAHIVIARLRKKMVAIEKEQVEKHMHTIQIED